MYSITRDQLTQTPGGTRGIALATALSRLNGGCGQPGRASPKAIASQEFPLHCSTRSHRVHVRRG
jgi:hypothetical protein